MSVGLTLIACGVLLMTTSQGGAFWWPLLGFSLLPIAVGPLLWGIGEWKRVRSLAMANSNYDGCAVSNLPGSSHPQSPDLPMGARDAYVTAVREQRARQES